MVTELPEPGSGFEERLLELVDASARRNVRKAQRAGFEVARDEDALDDLRRLHEENMAAIGGAAKSPAFFDAVPRHFRAGEEWQLWVARRDGAAAGALLTFHFARTAEYYTPAIAHDHRSDQPLAALLVAAMADAAERGMRRWNWGGTWRSQTGVYRFKRKWGADERRYRYLTQLNDERLLDSSPQELGARFANFFVVPFDALRAAGAPT
jgi:lipid II:glycine glycyltransferase (peptidoglycan interpeptide bridge formation enzyme)